MDIEEKISLEPAGGLIERVNIDDEMKSAYIDYSMSVIVSRALPDARDGLKPVQRRVLFGMNAMGLSFSGATKKCARIVGEVMGKYHPHGDSSVYDTMARLAQDWNQRYPLVHGQGNFGSVDGDPVAAMRYTEAKMAKLTPEVLADIDKNTVEFQPNFDETTKEPTVLPTKLPLLLLNGSAGIAVGMATNMAPHNLGEVCDALCAYIDNRDITTDELMKYLKGPDFPTGGSILGVQGIRDAYETGRGRVVIRSKTDIEVDEKGVERIVVTEIPYMVNKAEMVNKVAQLVKEKKIEGISECTDETSAKRGMRVVFKIKQGANSNVVLNTLLKYTALQSSFAINNVAIVNGRPRTMGLKEMLKVFVDFRHEVIVRRTKFDLNKALERSHIVEGLLRAKDILDEIIALIRASRTSNDAKEQLVAKFDFSERQAEAIVAMRLGQLAGLEIQKLMDEYDGLVKFIDRCNEILSSETVQYQLIKDETQEIKAKYADPRRTEIIPSAEEFNPEDFYADEDVVITISHDGYIKRTPLTEFRTQSRGGVGAKASATKEEDFIEHIYVANMHSTMLFFTQQGRCYWLKVYEIPEGTRTSKGRAVQNLLNISSEDKIRAYVNVNNLNDPEYTANNYIVLVTKRGILKKTSLEAYSHPRANGVNAVTIREGDELLEAILTNGKSQIFIAAREGRCVRFEETEARPLGRTASGVRGINIEESDEVIGAISYDPADEHASDNTVLVVSEHGFGKRTDFDEYRLTARGGKGVKTMNLTDKTGKLVAIKSVTEQNDLMIINKSGLTIRTSVSEIRVAGRATQGVKLIKIRENDSITAVSVVAKNEEDNSADAQQGQDAPAETPQENA